MRQSSEYSQFCKQLILLLSSHTSGSFSQVYLLYIKLLALESLDFPCHIVEFYTYLQISDVSLERLH